MATTCNEYAFIESQVVLPESRKALGRLLRLAWNLVLTRISLERYPMSGATYLARTHLMRNSDGQLYLVEEPQEPGDREVVTAISHKRAVAWLSADPARRRGTAAADRKRAERFLSAA
ncbi:hypothetical protein ABIG06_001529 [Bradyrhizobium sp. USDA 326]|uniref:hypothetical protein n=2 Tax=Bradyrhizobium TaxID=374 RepID=UPI00351886C5